jgi:glycosyltransferase involved in cell wall biosynthesis
MKDRRFKLAILNSHPIQYFAPFYRSIAATPDIDLTVYYCSHQGVSAGHRDPGFGQEVIWDTPLLQGYRSKFLNNATRSDSVGGFFSLINWDIVPELLRNRYDAVVIHGHQHFTSLLAVLVAVSCRTATFMRADTHLLLRRSTVKRLIRWPLMTAFYKLFDCCLYIGTRNREFYEAHGVSDQKLEFVPFAVDNDFFSRCEAREILRTQRLAALKLDPSLPVVLYAAKMTRGKRPHDLVAAFNRASNGGVNASLILIGDGALRPSLEEQVVKLNCRNVRFVGFQNQSQLPGWFHLSDIFVLPSENETWGLVINEAMNASLPVITTHEVGASVDLVKPDVTGYTYAAGSVDDLRGILKKMIENPKRRASMGRQAKALIQDWSYERGIDGLRRALASHCR